MRFKTIRATPRCEVRLATLYVRDGRLKEALDRSNARWRSIPIRPTRACSAAGISSALGDDATAEKDYQEVLQLNPKNQEAYLYLGTLYAKRGDYAEAEQDLPDS